MAFFDFLKRFRSAPKFTQVVRIGQAALAKASNRQLETTPPPTEYNAYFLQSSPVYRAVHLRSDAVSSARIVVMDHRKELPEPVGDDHPVQQMFDRMNRWWTSSDMVYGTEAYLSLLGSAFWHIDKDTNPQQPDIFLLRPDLMQVIPDQEGDEYIKGFKYTPSPGNVIGYLPDEIMWFRRFNPLEEFAGAAPVAPGRASFDSGIEATLYNRKFFANGAMPSDLVFTVNQPVSTEEYEDFEKRLNERHRGTKNAHKPIVWDLTNGAEPKRLGLTQKDMEFIAGLQWNVEEAARVFGVMPPLMMDREHTNVGDVKQARIEFYQSTVTSEWKFLQDEINELLLPTLGKMAEGLKVRFASEEVPSVQQARATEREVNLKELDKGTMTINEYRAKEGREPVDWGDVVWLPNNLMPVSSGEMPELPAAEGNSEPAEDDDVAPAEQDDEGDTVEESVDRLIASVSGIRKEYTRKQWSRELIESHVKGEYDAGLTITDRFEKMQNRLFKQQLRATNARVKELGAELPGDEKAFSVPETEQRAFIDRIFNPTAWVQMWTTRGFPIYRAAFVFAGRQAADDFNIGPFNPDSEDGRAFLEKRTAFWATRVNNETARLLEAEIQASLASGEGVPGLQKRVTKVFGFGEDFRTERIARTEMGTAASAGKMESFKQNPNIKQKQWITVVDSRTREAHVAAHLQVRDFANDFRVMGEGLDAPRLGGSAGNVINCRCTVVPILVDQEPVTGEMVNQPTETPVTE